MPYTLLWLRLLRAVGQEKLLMTGSALQIRLSLVWTDWLRARRFRLLEVCDLQHDPSMLFLPIGDKLIIELYSHQPNSSLYLVAVYLFKGVVQLEIQRRENSKKSRALILQMADMMGALLQLANVQDPDLEDEKSGQSIKGRVQVLMKSIESDIKDCGNLVDTYAKHSVAS